MYHHADYLADHPFWRFATKIQSHCEVKNSLDHLQNHYGLNPNLLLFCCWHAEAGKGKLSKSDIVQLINSNGAWFERVQHPLSRLNLQLQNTRFSDQFKQEIQATQKLAEHIEQLMLTEVPVKFSQKSRTTEQKLIDCCKNILTYSKILVSAVSMAMYEYFLPILLITFPTLDSKEIQRLSQSAILEEKQRWFYGQKKLWLD